MRGSGVVAVSLVLVACPKDPPMTGTGASTGEGSSTGSTTGTGSTAEAPTGGATAATGTTAAATEAAPTGTTGAATTGTTADVWTEATATGRETSGEGGDSTTGPPPRLFDCYGCDCDANTSYCQQVFNGVAGPPFPRRDPPMCPEVEPDSLENGCALYPARCEGLPTCTCLPQMGGACFCTEVGPGVFEVVCPLP